MWWWVDRLCILWATGNQTGLVYCLFLLILAIPFVFFFFFFLFFFLSLMSYVLTSRRYANVDVTLFFQVRRLFSRHVFSRRLNRISRSTYTDCLGADVATLYTRGVGLIGCSDSYSICAARAVLLPDVHWTPVSNRASWSRQSIAFCRFFSTDGDCRFCADCRLDEVQLRSVL